MAKKPDTRTDTRFAEGMKTTSFKAHQDILEAIEERAAADGVSRADVIREALIQYLGLPPDTTRVVGRTDR